MMNLKRKYAILIAAGICCLWSCSSKNDSNPSEALFTLLSPDSTQIHFQNELTEALNTNILMYEYFYNGGGVAAADFNNDGNIDLYFTSNMADNALYINRGHMQFDDVTNISNAAGRSGPWKTGVNAVDINGDNRMDIYVCYSGALPPEKRKNQLFINMGNNATGVPIFEEKAEAFGLAQTGFSNQSYFLDYDKDGDLDMLLLNHNPKNLPLLSEQGTAELFKVDNPDKGLRFLKQNQQHQFEDVTVSSGINGSELSYGLGLAISDFNNDGWPDFYVSNDYAVPDYIYINNKNGTFSNKIAQSMGHTSQFSMGNDAVDVNNDALTDMFTLDMLPEDNRRQKLLMAPDNYEKFDQNVRSGFYYQFMRNMLHLNNGNGTFSEVGQLEGISNTDWSWSALFADYDNDGWKDLYITNGYFRDFTNQDFIFYMNEYIKEKGRMTREDVMEIIKQMPSSNVMNYIFQNKQGKGFNHMNEKWGMKESSNSNGAAYADLDNDGDLDLIVNNINLPAFIYRNDANVKSGNHFLQVRLQGEKENTEGIGARISINCGGQKQLLEQYPTRGYLSHVSNQMHFGLGNKTSVDTLEIRWNSGKMQTVFNIKADQTIVLREKDAKENFKEASKVKPIFEEQLQNGISYIDSFAVVNDFNRQPLLITAFSNSGPSMAKGDIDGDGLEDIIVGGSGNQATALYVQQKNGSFLQKKFTAFETDKAFVDADINIFDANNDGKNDVYIASGGYDQFNQNDPMLQDRLYINNGSDFVKTNSLPKLTSSKSCIRTEDINGDGLKDLFIGGRVVPGEYPANPASYILINKGNGVFTDMTSSMNASLGKIGMVTDAAWVDLDGDKNNELIVVGEWMPITIFKKDKGTLVEITNKFLDKQYTGWWNKITVGDFNSDGKTDLIIGNCGLNTQFRASDEEPLELFYPDLDKNGKIDPIFSYYINHKRYPYLTRDELVGQIPSLKKRFSTFKDYADVTLEDLSDEDELSSNGHLTANHMQTTLFLSDPSGKMKMQELPMEMQYAPVYSILNLDYDGDGQSDLLVFGNNSKSKLRLGKFDANYGMLFKGNGKGSFIYIPQSVSGFNIWGDVKNTLMVDDRIFIGVNGKKMITYKKVK